MDKFVHRTSTWKTTSYEMITAKVATKKNANESTNRRSISAGGPNKFRAHSQNENSKRKTINPCETRENITQKLLKSHGISKDSPLVDKTLLQNIPENFRNLSNTLTSTKIAIGDQYNDENSILKTQNTNYDECRNACNHIIQELSPIMTVEGFKPNEDQRELNTNSNPYLQTEVEKESAIETNNIRTPTTKINPTMMRIQADMNSPSATLRIRAQRAMMNAAQNAYVVFDVPHEEQSIITAEERNPPVPLTIQEIMSSVIVYVEVRSGEDNRSQGVKAVIAALGAQVNDRLLRNTTHVIFKDGLLSTYKKARAWNIPVVSILWIEACKNKRKLCDPTLFPITNLDKYENPELYPKMMRQRSMQPDSEINKRVRRPATPTLKDSTPKSAVRRKINNITTPSQQKRTEISNFVKVLSSKKSTLNLSQEGVLEEPSVESPATKYLNRITLGTISPLQSAHDINNGNDEADINIGDVAANNDIKTQYEYVKKIITFSAEKNINGNNEAEDSTPKQRIRRRRTMESIPCTAVASSTSTPVRMTRRRSSMLNNSPSVEKTNSVSMSITQPNFPDIPEEDTSAAENNKNTTNYENQSLEITELFKPKLSETKRTISNESMDISVPKSTDAAELCPKAKSGDIVATDSKLSNLLQDDGAMLSTFSSTRLPCSQNRRRSFFDISMDIINQRLLTINETSKRKSLAKTELEDKCSSLDVQTPKSNTCSAQGSQTKLKSNDSTLEEAPVKKRILFDPITEPTVTPKNQSATKKTNSKSANRSKRRCSLMTTSELAKPKADSKVKVTNLARRSTLDFEQLQNIQKKTVNGTDQTEVTEEATTENKTKDADMQVELLRLPTKRRRLSNLVYTNMRQEQISVIRQAIKKLGCFRIQNAVNKVTTHIVSLEPRRTLNLMRGLMRGTWILQYRWVLDSIRAGAWLNEEHYEMKIFSRAVEICRAERQAFGRNYRCELFRHMGIFYVSARCKNISCEQLTELLALGNANLTDHRYKAKYIVGDKRRELDDKIYLSPQWVLDSIAAMQILKFSKYLMPSAIIPLPSSMLPETPQLPPSRILPQSPYD